MPEQPEQPNANRKKNDSMGRWVAIGVAIGAGLGVAMGNIALGVGIGIVLGIVVGIAQRKRGGKDINR